MITAKELGEQGARISYGGLTKRELFAATAMQGISANPQTQGKQTKDLVQAIAKVSVLMADALLAELAKDVP